jgi:hypothetical protein
MDSYEDVDFTYGEQPTESKWDQLGLNDKRFNEILKYGWQDPGETWTYASPTTITISGDVSSRYSIGMKVKLTQTTIKYFVIAATPTYSAPNTTLTLHPFVSGMSVANAAITDNYYSLEENPLEFPGKPRARAYLGSTLTTTVSVTATKVALGAESYDVGANFADGKFTAPVNGYYYVSAMVYFVNITAGGKYFQTLLYVDGSSARSSTIYSAAAGNGLSPNLSDVIYLNAGQVVALYYTHNDATTVDLFVGTTCLTVALQEVA